MSESTVMEIREERQESATKRFSFFKAFLPSEQIAYKPVLIESRTIIDPTVEIFNIPFVVKHRDEIVVLECQRWPSLSVFGDSVEEAIESLGSLLKDMIDEYVLVPEERLSPDAIEFRNFLIRKLF